MLDCGHPDECWDEDEGSRWCDETDRLRLEVETLTRLIESKAIILQPGTHDLTVDTIGYLALRDGCVANFGAPVAVPFLSLPEKKPAGIVPQ